MMRKFTSIGEPVEVVNHEPEGCLMQVLAISYPYVLVKVHPIPCEDAAHPHHPSFNVTWDWRTVEFIRPSRSYLRTYLRLRRKSGPQFMSRRKSRGVSWLKKAPNGLPFLENDSEIDDGDGPDLQETP
jgi:hypothetical protein